MVYRIKKEAMIGSIFYVTKLCKYVKFYVFYRATLKISKFIQNFILK